ncbi:hypothetical protein [Cellulomonas sp. S1-8]|uniref:hypothetical protein n=1 Tax=Cellulomonas sp. S1-8 TaxID=2904790 RepID=UPI0022444B5D|nr:hypothetical protein [Cellulomonas sp. S1-8]UZN02521.1 hypothetical protein OKX07_15885 [Cellulomonas sp. S1-8]
MPMTRTGWRTRARTAAVAIVLLVGAGATLATTPPTEKCPDPPADGVISDFYGPQDYVGGMARFATPSAFVVGGIDVVRVDVRAPGCLSADSTEASVGIFFRIGGEYMAAVPEETLRTLSVSDGRGRTWSPEEVDSRAWLPPRSQGGNPEPAYARLEFLLPVDLVAPVTLHLGELRGETVEALSLDESEPRPGTT